VQVLPIDETFLYVLPIYIQAAQARMPQLRKVALVQGDTLIYADTYDEAIAELQAAQSGKPVSSHAAPPGTSPPPITSAPAPGQSGNDPRIGEIRMHLQRYRDLSAQGKWADAGKELEAVENAVKK
jgi:uncharacterized protein